MATPVIMPKMGYDMTDGVVARWLKQPGDTVTKGEPIAEVETDKVNIEIEAFVSGTLQKIIAEPGARIPVGQPIAEIDTGEAGPPPAEMKPVGAGEGGEAVPEQQKAAGGQGRAIEEKTGPSASRGLEKPISASNGGTANGPAPSPMRQAGPMPGGGRIKASPLARRMAEEAGLPLAELQGTGPGGRITKADVEAALAEKPTAMPSRGGQAPRPQAPVPAGQPAKLGRGQSAVARIMTIAKQTIPHFYVTMPIDMEAAEDFREDLNEQLADRGVKISLNDMIVKACALALRETPALARMYTDEGVVGTDGLHIAIAVAVADGIISPVVRDADRTPLVEIAKQSRQMIQDARAGKLGFEQMQGGLFTVSNLGSTGVENFVAIITPPQSGVLAVGAVLDEAVVWGDEIIPTRRMRVTLSADHRVAGGMEGAQFLQRVRDRLERPVLLLID